MLRAIRAFVLHIVNRRDFSILLLCAIAVVAILFARFTGPGSADALDVRSIFGPATRTTMPAAGFSLDPTTRATTLPTTQVAPTSLPEDEADPIILPVLKGLFLLDSVDKIVTAPEYTQPITIDGPTLALDRELHRKLSQFIGKPLRVSDLNELTKAIVLEYNRMGRPVVDAITPEQDVTSGVVQVVILEGKVGRVILDGNRHFSTEVLGGRLRIRKGDPIERDKLLADVDALNRNPYRNVGVEFVKGKNPGETDIVFRVTEQTPLRAYTSYDNTGSESTGINRWTAGINYGNLFGLDQIINYQLTVGDDFNQFQAHSASWTIPLAWRHEIVLNGSLSLTQPSVDRPGFDLTGETLSLGAKYVIPLKRKTWLQHQISLGTEFERSNNNLAFGREEVFDRSTDVVQLELAYDATVTDKWGRTRVGASAVFSPGNITDGNDEAAFSRSRSGADPTYAAIRLNLDRTTPLPLDLRLLSRFSGQLSTGALLGSQQIGVGGANTVRGFPERAGNGDHGFFISNELQLPAISPANMISGGRYNDELRFVAFFDYGIAYNTDLMDADDRRSNPARSVFASFGPGVRYSFSPFFTVNYDYGIRLTDFDDGKDAAHHVSINFSYQW